MLDSIRDFLKSIVGVVDKSDVEMDLQKSVQSLDAAYSAYQIAATIEDVSGLWNKDTKNLIKQFYNVIDRSGIQVRLYQKDDFFGDVATLIKNAIANAEFIGTVIRDMQNDQIVGEAMEAGNAIVLRSVPHYYFISKYALSLINFIVATESNLANRTPTNIPKRTIDEIFANMRVFAKLMSIYGEEPTVFQKKILSIPKTVITATDNERVDNYQDYTRIDIASGIPFAGFIGNPIYSVRSMIASWQAGRYHKLQSEKPLIELRLAEWKNRKEGGDVDPIVEKRIVELQDELTSTERKIKSMEDSVK